MIVKQVVSPYEELNEKLYDVIDLVEEKDALDNVVQVQRLSEKVTLNQLKNRLASIQEELTRTNEILNEISSLEI
jgi:cell shape-determining protein MreC